MRHGSAPCAGLHWCRSWTGGRPGQSCKPLLRRLPHCHPCRPRCQCRCHRRQQLQVQFQVQPVMGARAAREGGSGWSWAPAAAAETQQVARCVVRSAAGPVTAGPPVVERLGPTPPVPAGTDRVGSHAARGQERHAQRKWSRGTVPSRAHLARPIIWMRPTAAHS